MKISFGEKNEKKPLGPISKNLNSSLNQQASFDYQKPFGNNHQSMNSPFSRMQNFSESRFSVRKNEGNDSRMIEKKGKIVDILVKGSIYLIVFFLPLFFLSNIPSSLELAKQIFLTVFVGVGFLAWVGKMAWKNEIRMRKSFILVPIFTLLVVFGMSVIFSKYVNQSLWGYFGGEGEAYLSLLFFVAFFLLVFNNIKQKNDVEKTIYFFLAGGFLAFILSLLQLWGKYLLPGEVTKNNFFNTVGSVYIFSVFLASLFLLSLSMFINATVKWKAVFFAVLATLLFFGMGVFNLKIVWWGLILALAFILGVSIVNVRQKNSQKRILAMVFLVLSLVMLNIKNSFFSKDFPVEVFLKQKIGASIMLSAWKKDPMLGIGQGNFISIYQNNRPDNLGDFWSVNFNSSSSLFMTIASTTGILGTLAFIFFVLTSAFGVAKGVIISLGVHSLPKKDEFSGDFILSGLASVWLFLTFIAFFYFFNMTIWLVWWLCLALIFSLIYISQKNSQDEYVTNSNSPGSSLALSFVFVLVIIGFITAIYAQGQKYVAAVYFNQALVADTKGEKIEDVAMKIEKAVQLDPSRDVYYRNLSVASFALANKRIAEKGQEELSTEDIAYIKGMIARAKSYSEKAIELNQSPENYLSLAQVYEGVLGSMEGADKELIANYQKAIELDSHNPALYVKLASVYVSLANIEASKENSKQTENKEFQLPEKSKEYLIFAKDEIAKARQIKNDYVDANLFLASILEMEGNIDGAIEKEKENKSLFPGSPELYFRLGLLYYKKEMLAEARDEFKGAIAINKDYSNARYFLGLIYDKQKEKALAIEQFEKIAEVNADNQTVKSILDNLKNGKDALAGLDNQAVQKEQIKSSTEPKEKKDDQTISPQVEPQQIPEEAIPASEEEVSQPQPQPSEKPKEE